MKLTLFVFLASSLWAGPAVLPVLIGQTYQIDQPWKAQVGDDPRWAAPDFDDSGWGDASAIPRITGYVWYRQSILLPAGDGPLSLWIPNIASAGEVYLNGERALEFGTLTQWWTHRRDPVPPVVIASALRKGTTLVIAVRVKKLAASAGINGSTLVGDAGRIAAEYAAARLNVWRNSVAALVILIFPLATSLAFLLYWAGRRDRMEQFWFATLCLGYFASDLDQLRPMGLPQSFALIIDWLGVLAGYGTWRFFQGPGKAASNDRWQLGFGLLAAFMCLAQVLDGIELFVFFGLFVYMGLTLQAVIIRLLRGEVKVLWLYLPYALVSVGEIVYYLRVLSTGLTGQQVLNAGSYLRYGLMTEPFSLDLGQVGQLLSLGVMSTIVLRGVLQLREEKQMLESELEAARQVQQLLVPAAGVEVPGFAVESVYVPAQQVGGDFFLLTAIPGDGLLAVVGDVSGKGLRAAMVVSLIIGALRSRRSDAPGQVLQDLNDALCAQATGGFTTCCCVRVHSGGAIEVANAGHPAPYVDGAELSTSPGLPLGLMPSTSYEECASALAPGSQLTLVSDGVVEAENARRELFGFERTREMSSKSAQEIAEAAKAWGQNDDITVVTVRRME